MASLVLGVLGGIGSGKSTVAAMFEKLGAVLIDADKLAHEALAQPEVIHEIRTIWGEKVLSAGSIDRKELARAVFRSKEEIEKLNSIIHPRVIERIKEETGRILQSGKSPAVVIDAPLLLEAGLDSVCDALVMVDTSPETRKERAKASKGITENDHEQREKFQISLDKKRKNAQYVVDNNSSEDSTFQQVSVIWNNLFNSQTAADRNRFPK